MNRFFQDIKLTEIRQFLMKNSIEIKVVTIKIFEININTLIIFMHRQVKKHEEKSQHEKHNKILIFFFDLIIECIQSKDYDTI